jgi:hypothetical protein
MKVDITYIHRNTGAERTLRQVPYLGAAHARAISQAQEGSINYPLPTGFRLRQMASGIPVIEQRQEPSEEEAVMRYRERHLSAEERVRRRTEEHRRYWERVQRRTEEHRRYWERVQRRTEEHRRYWEAQRRYRERARST